MFPLELISPWALITLLALPVIIWYYRWSLSDFPWRQQLFSFLTRAVIVVLLAFALAGLTWRAQTDQQYVICLIDRSLSVGDEGKKFLQEYLNSVQSSNTRHELAFLPFAETPGILAKSVPEELTAPPSERIPVEKTPDSDPGTRIADAITAAAGSIPAGSVPRLVLLTDGNQTAGDALQAAERAGIPCLTVPLPERTEKEVQVAEVLVPDEVREGEPFHVEVVVQSNHDDAGLIEVFRGDHKVISERRDFKTGENRFRFQQSIDRERLAAFAVRISNLNEDTLLDNNTGSGLVQASGKPRVLIIESDPGQIRELAYALEDEGIQADIRPPQGMPDSLTDLQNYELLMLSNVPATALTSQQMQIARTYVQDFGGGFLMLGGDQSFGLGGYYKTTLEEILPVRSDFEKEKEKPSVAMVLVIDKSGSMSGDNIEMAKSAASKAVELLGRRDQIGVIAFDGDTYVISEMQPVSNHARIQDDISRIDANGGTNMEPAMQEGFTALQRASAKLKHMILLTDGESTPGDFEGLAQQMASNKITVSTVALGTGSARELLEQIARVGKGRYYFTDDPASVPQIFAKETVTISKSAIDEQPFLPQVIRSTHALADLDLQAAPSLLGYVMTRPKPTSEVILATEKGDPLLVWWRYGLGMTGAFTSDAKSRWAAEWLTWPGYGKFWTQVIRQLMRKSDSRGVATQIVSRDGGLDIQVEAVDPDGRFLNEAEVEVTVINPQFGKQVLSLPQTAPGRYQQELQIPDKGQYHLEIATKSQGQVLSRQSRGVSFGYPSELRIRPTNEPLLRQIAAVTDGRFSPAASEVFDLPGTATRPVPLWPWLVTLAMLLFVIDVALRRIDFSLWKTAS